MDLDSLDAPMFVDFDLIKRGEEEGEGDEWFDKKIEDDDTFTNTPPVLGNPATSATSKPSHSLSPPQPVAREQPHVAEEEGPQETKEEKVSDDSVASALALMASKPPPTRPKKSSERSAALKATASIQSMLKPQTSNTGRSKLMTKDQSDLLKIEQIKKEAERQKALSKKSYKSFKKRCATGSHNSSSLQPLKPKPPTEPVEFHFKTDERFKDTTIGHTPSAAASHDSPFPNNLRISDRPDYNPNDPSERKPLTPKAPTVPKPFKFETESRIRSRGLTLPTDRYVSAAEFAEKFEKRTPPRFRTKRPRRSLSSERDYFSTKVTIARSPKLVSRHRSRSPNVMSATEKDEKLMEDMRKNPFKARPVPPNLFKGGEYCTGLPHSSSLNKIPVTKPASPNITKPKRDLTLPDTKESLPPEKRFKALPIPRDMFSSIKGVPEKRPMEITTPQSPNLTKRRKIEEEEVPPAAPIVTATKPLPMPKFDKPFQPILTHAHSTTIQPFSFDNKYTSKDELVEELRKKEDEEMAKRREFTACKMPEPKSPPPIIKSYMKTLAEPFSLMTEERGQKNVAKFNEKVAKLDKEREEMTKFTASDTKLFYATPFQPVKASKPLTEINSFDFQTETRAELRTQFELEKKAREEERERIKEEREAMREAEEAKEMKELRKSLVHKAQPIHQYSSIDIKPSIKPLTKPSGPALSSISRSRGEKVDL